MQASWGCQAGRVTAQKVQVQCRFWRGLPHQYLRTDPASTLLL